MCALLPSVDITSKKRGVPFSHKLGVNAGVACIASNRPQHPDKKAYGDQQSDYSHTPPRPR